MLTLPSPTHQAILQARTAYIPVVTVTAVKGATSVDFTPTVIQVNHDRRNTIRWDGSLTIALEANSPYIPTAPGDLLTNFGTRITVTAGIRNTAGVTSTVPCGVFLVSGSTVDVDPTGGVHVNLTLVGIAQAIADYRFENPVTVVAGTELAAAVNQIVLDRTGTDPGVIATGVTLGAARVFGLDPNLDPWAELMNLVGDFGYQLDYDRNGVLVLDQQPTPDPSTATALPLSVTVSGQFETRQANVVVARGETTEGIPPVQAVVMDDDPLSPTYAGPAVGSSPYGRVTRYYASPLLITTGQATLAAQSILRKTAGAGAGWTVTKAFDPTFDPGDVLGLPVGTGTVPAVVEAVQLGQTLTLQCRAISELV